MHCASSWRNVSYFNVKNKEVSLWNAASLLEIANFKHKILDMKQLYYVVQTLLHGRNANVIKIVSLGLGLMMSILLFSRVAYEQSFDTCFKEHENPVISIKSEWYNFRHGLHGFHGFIAWCFRVIQTSQRLKTRGRVPWNPCNPCLIKTITIKQKNYD